MDHMKVLWVKFKNEADQTQKDLDFQLELQKIKEMKLQVWLFSCKKSSNINNMDRFNLYRPKDMVWGQHTYNYKRHNILIIFRTRTTKSKSTCLLNKYKEVWETQALHLLFDEYVQFLQLIIITKILPDIVISVINKPNTKNTSHSKCYNLNKKSSLKRCAKLRMTKDLCQSLTNTISMVEMLVVVHLLRIEREIILRSIFPFLHSLKLMEALKEVLLNSITIGTSLSRNLKSKILEDNVDLKAHIHHLEMRWSICAQVICFKI